MAQQENKKRCIYCGAIIKPKMGKYCDTWCRLIYAEKNQEKRKELIKKKEEFTNIDKRIALYIKHDFTLETMYKLIKNVPKKVIKEKAEKIAQNSKCWLYRTPKKKAGKITWGDILAYNKKLQKDAGWEQERKYTQTHYSSDGLPRGRFIR